MYYIRINGECACVSKLTPLAFSGSEWITLDYRCKVLHYGKASDATPDLDKLRAEFPGAKIEIVIGECTAVNDREKT